jgi:hypothetical protein
LSRNDDLVPLLAKTLPECTLLTGSVVAWAQGSFVIRLLGVNLANLPVLSSAGGFSPGDSVAVLRQKSSYLVLGKIVPAGS